MEAARFGDTVLRQFYQERDVVLEERRMRTDDSGDGRLYEALLQTAFTTHPYRNPVIGYPQDISGITATETAEFRKRFYVPENAVVAVVGDLESEVVFSTIERYFGRLRKGSVRRNLVPAEPAQSTPRSSVVNFPAEPQTYLAYHKPTYPHPDAIPIILANQILGGGPTAILYRELVEKQRILSSIEATEAPGSAYPNLWVLAFAPRSPHTNAEGRAALRDALDSITLDDIAEQIEASRRALIVGEMAKLRSNSSVALDLASTELLFGSWRASIDQLAELKRVTPEMVFDVIKRYLVSNNETAAILERASVSPLGADR
jgi:predicted Zn-dependent peptidase